MHFSLSTLLSTTAVTFLLNTSPSTSLTIPYVFPFNEPNSPSTALSINTTLSTIPSSNLTALIAPPIHVPICGPTRGRTGADWTLLTCARLLVNLKNLPSYTKTEIWSKFQTGESHLPTTFSLTDPASQKTCYLTFDLFNAAAQITASEKFSLQEEQTDLNRIYYNCLKAGGVYGVERLGVKGNVAALLGPRYADPIVSMEMGGAFARGGGDDGAAIIDLTPYGNVAA